MATHSSILAWRSSWTGKPGGLQSIVSQRVRHNWTTNTFFTFMLWTEHLFLPKIHMSKSSLSKWWFFGGGTFGRYIGNENKVLMNEIICIFKKGTPESSPALFYHVRIQWKDWHLQPRTWPCWCPDLGLPVSRTVRNQCLLSTSHSVCGTLL